MSLMLALKKVLFSVLFFKAHTVGQTVVNCYLWKEAILHFGFLFYLPIIEGALSKGSCIASASINFKHLKSTFLEEE